MLNHQDKRSANQPLPQGVVEAIVNGEAEAACDDLTGYVNRVLASETSEDTDRRSWHRWQDPVIEQLIPEGGTLLDLGCGDGQLLERVIQGKKVCAQGIELDGESVIRCIERGVPVFHGDVDEGLGGFSDQSFDVVVLEETLQTLQRPIEVLEEMMRVGRQSIVSFPNFAHWKVRVGFSTGGRMPVTETLPHAWHNTPNIHLCSIRDFLDWTVKARVHVRDAYVLTDNEVRQLQAGDNVHAAEALFVVDREPGS